MLEKEKQSLYTERFGAWYESSGQYLHAIASYRRSGNHDALLRVIQKDAGILLSSLDPQIVLADIEACPVSVLKEHPLSILVLMRCMFYRRLSQHGRLRPPLYLNLRLLQLPRRTGRSMAGRRRQQPGLRGSLVQSGYFGDPMICPRIPGVCFYTCSVFTKAKLRDIIYIYQ